MSTKEKANEFKLLIEKDLNIQDRELKDKYAASIVQLKHDTDCAIRAFDEKTYWVVCLGAAKSGKSTLLNVLSGNSVSPAGPATETTRRCSVILAADEKKPEGMILYRLKEKDKTPDELKNITEYLLEYIKNTREWEDIEQNIEKLELPINENNLNKFLTSPKEKLVEDCPGFGDFFLAEIRIDAGGDDNVLQEGVALVDMPGLDGVSAGVEENPIISFICKLCHHFLLVQSTITTLNSVTKQELEKIIIDKSDSAKFHVIFNKINAKLEWKNKDSIAEEQSQYYQQASKELGKVISSEDPAFSVNLGMAWAALSDSFDLNTVVKHEGVAFADGDVAEKEKLREELLKQSGINAFKTRLLKFVNDNKTGVILKSAQKKVENLKRFFKDEGELGNLKQEMANGKTKENNFCENLNKDKDNVKSICIDAKSDKNKKDFIEVFEKILTPAAENIEIKAGYCEINARDFKTEIAKVKEKFWRDIETTEKQCNRDIKDKIEEVLKEKVENLKSKFSQNDDFKTALADVSDLSANSVSIEFPGVEEFFQKHPISAPDNWFIHGVKWLFKQKVNITDSIRNNERQYRKKAERELKDQAECNANKLYNAFCDKVDEVKKALIGKIDGLKEKHSQKAADYEAIVRRINDLDSAI